MTVRLLGMSFSPRSESNSAALVRHSLEALKERYGDDVEFDLVDARDHDVKGCQYCAVCGKTKDGKYQPCVMAGKDEVQAILDKMLAAHGLIIATPVYFGLPSDLFSKFIMRTRVLRHQDFRLANRPVGVMAIAARRSGGAETAIMSTWLPFIRNGCLVVGNGDGTCQFGAYGWAGGRGHILSDEWGMEQGFQVAERVFSIARLVQAGSRALDFTNPMTFSHTAGTRP